MYNIIYETSRQSRFDARYWMLGAGALGRPRGMVRGGRVMVLNKAGLTKKVGEGNGTPLQYSHLENPMDGGAW